VADDLHPYPLTRHTVHLCVDMQRLLFNRRSVADAVDGSGAACRNGVGQPASRAHRVHTVHSTGTCDRNAGYVAAVLHEVEGCNAGTSRSRAPGASAVACKTLSAGNRDRQNQVLRVYRIQARRTSARQRRGWPDRDGIRNRRLRACNGSLAQSTSAIGLS
jgi:hypothetical protein